jgi:hypothetical protein
VLRVAAVSFQLSAFSFQLSSSVVRRPSSLLMPTTITRLFAYDGPNLYGSQPSVVLQVQADKDRSARMRNALKDGAQSIGLVIGYLDVEAMALDSAFLITAHFVTPTPQIGAELARYVVERLNAKERGDEEWDAEEPLWNLQKRRRAEALPVQALQITAEAASRGVPTFLHMDGKLQIGYGARGWALDLAPFKDRRTSGVLSTEEIGIGPPPFARAEAAATVPWEQIGPIPIIAVSGGSGRDLAAQAIAGAIRAQEHSAGLAEAADIATTQALLADPAHTLAIVGLEPAGLALRGLAFERCAYSAVVSLPDELPPDVADREELARVLGIPMLVTDPDGCAVLNVDEPLIAALAEYAPCPVIYISVTPDNATVSFHRAKGGAAVFVRDGAIIAANGPDEQVIAAIDTTDASLPGALAALAILRAMGLGVRG